MRMIRMMIETNLEALSNSRFGLKLLLCLCLVFVNPELAIGQGECITTKQYYGGSVDPDANYCELETRIAVKKFRSEIQFSNDEISFLQERHKYFIFVNLVPRDADKIRDLDSGNSLVELATISMIAYSQDMDETHSLLVAAYLMLARTIMIETFFDIKLPTAHAQLEALLENDRDRLGLQGSTEGIIDCYWKTFVPGREVIETISSKLFEQCVEEVDNGK